MMMQFKNVSGDLAEERNIVQLVDREDQVHTQKLTFGRDAGFVIKGCQAHKKETALVVVTKATDHANHRLFL